MISLKRVTTVEAVNLEFNEYVPMTLTWTGSGGVLESPRYVNLRSENSLLELKFHPNTGILIEVVLVAAPEMEIELRNLSPAGSDGASLMPFLDSSDSEQKESGVLVVKAYLDYLCISFGLDSDRWVGSGPVRFGLAGEETLTAICARWTGSERETVLAG